MDQSLHKEPQRTSDLKEYQTHSSVGAVLSCTLLLKEFSLLQVVSLYMPFCPKNKLFPLLLCKVRSCSLIVQKHMTLRFTIMLLIQFNVAIPCFYVNKQFLLWQNGFTQSLSDKPDKMVCYCDILRNHIWVLIHSSQPTAPKSLVISYESYRGIFLKK